MGDLIGESLSGNLVFIKLEQIDKIRSLNISSLDKIKSIINWVPKINLDQIIQDVAKYEIQRNLGHP